MTRSEEAPSPKSLSIYIDGFRSLRDFEITLNSGINILAGPNGSGKTNFLEFLDFITEVIKSNASTATSEAGGVARVFSQENIRRKVLIARISGIAFINDVDEDQFFYFDYEVEITFSKGYSFIFISRETIGLGKRYSDPLSIPLIADYGSITIKRSPDPEAQPKVKIGGYLKSKSKSNPLAAVPSEGNFLMMSKFDHGDPNWMLGLRADESIFVARPAPLVIEVIRETLSRTRCYNLIPNRIRLPNDLARSPNISLDGAGLTSTLFHLQRAKTGSNRFLFRRLRPEYWGYILEFTKLVLPELKDITVTADPHTGKYLGYLIIGKDNLRIPLQAASDGTIKWLVLVTLIVTSRGAFSMEEPENFLHPRMQQFLIDIMRDSIETTWANSFTIISTHSETLINKCNPDELIIFEFKSDRTRCKRIENPLFVQDQINSTGFGLGYYYANNAIS